MNKPQTPEKPAEHDESEQQPVSNIQHKLSINVRILAVVVVTAVVIVAATIVIMIKPIVKDTEQMKFDDVILTTPIFDKVNNDSVSNEENGSVSNEEQVKWTPFINQDDGYKFNYPDNWEITRVDRSVIFNDNPIAKPRLSVSLECSGQTGAKNDKRIEDGFLISYPIGTLSPCRQIKFLCGYQDCAQDSVMDQIQSSLRFLDNYYVNRIGEWNPPEAFTFQLIYVNREGSEEIIIDNINATFGDESPEIFPTIFSFARSENKLYLRRYIDGTEETKDLFEYDVITGAYKEVDAIPHRYFFGYNSIRAQSPDGTKVAVYGSDDFNAQNNSNSVAVFDLTKNKEVKNTTASNTGYQILPPDILGVDVTEQVVDFFQWKTPNVLEYPAYEQTTLNNYRLKAIKSLVID